MECQQNHCSCKIFDYIQKNIFFESFCFEQWPAYTMAVGAQMNGATAKVFSSSG